MADRFKRSPAAPALIGEPLRDTDLRAMVRLAWALSPKRGDVKRMPTALAHASGMSRQRVYRALELLRRHAPFAGVARR